MSEHVLRAAARELRRVLSGAVSETTGADRFAVDFGGQLVRRPALVATVQGEADIAAALEVATRYRLPCRVRGAGHSCGGQTLVEGGLVLHNTAERVQPVNVHHDGSLATSAGNRWTWVARAVRAHGRAIPVLGDWPSLTVGGTLAVGGFGVASLKWGGQGNHVTRIRLVLPDGRALWCSPTEEAELFRYTLAGLGSFGVIERVVMRTIPYARWLSLRTYRAAGLDAVTAAANALAQWQGPPPDVFYYSGKRERFVVGTAAHTIMEAWRMPALPPFAAFRQSSHLVLPNQPALAQLGVAAWLARFPQHMRVWSDYVLPAAALPEFLDYVSAARRSGVLARQLRTIYVLGIRTPVDATPIPFAPVGDPPAPLTFGVGLYCMVPAQQRAELSGVRTALRRVLERCVALGGRPYLYGWHELDAELLERAYGPALSRYRTMRREHDPHGIFHPVFEAA